MRLKAMKKAGNYWNEAGSGQGDPSKEKDFAINIEEGEVKEGQTYKIMHSDFTYGNAPCKKTAIKGQIAEFGPYQPADDEVEAEGTSLVMVQQMQSLLLAAKKSVSIEIDSVDLVGLKQAGYRLCFAKKVAEGDYNVVWQSYTKYLASNQFSWTPLYQLFGSNRFESNITVQVQTNIVDIGLGEKSTLDEYGVLSPPSTGGAATSINLINDYDSIHPGVNQISTGINGARISTPIYVAKSPIVKGEAKLTPVERVLVWFEQNVETSTMFSDARSRAVEIDLTHTNSATRLYQGGSWKIP